MPHPLKILFVSAEVAPFAKVGGLADVAGALPKALRRLGHDVRVVMPAYAAIEAQGRAGQLNTRPGGMIVNTGAGPIAAGIYESTLPGSDVPIYFIAQWHLFDRPNVYGYPDDPYRFAFFSLAAFELTNALGWQPDVLHAHDWHTAPAVTWLATAGRNDPRFHALPSVFTIHNLAHQGRTNWDVFRYMGLLTNGLAEEGYGEVNFMARGIYHATMINTVSPNYAREIMTYEGGSGLHHLLRFRHYDLHGLLNGVDEEVFNPETDTRLAQRFTANQLDARADNKRALQQKLGLPERPEVPIVGMVTRLDRQKGLDIVGHVMHLLLNGAAGDAQVVVVGTGDAGYEEMFRQLAGYHTDKLRAVLAFAPEIAQLVYGGSDMFLMPSLFEPCGLGQLIAMRYGSVPVVRAVGGLADTVRDSATGFLFDDFSSEACWHALQRAIYIYNIDKDSWRAIQRNGMTANFSWRNSALGYQQMYEWALARMRGW
ncbi:MAG: glycogen synthase [Anaerolineales bacterium]|nr:glycogen synthase [Anaerolineales bacterium]